MSWIKKNIGKIAGGVAGGIPGVLLGAGYDSSKNVKGVNMNLSDSTVNQANMVDKLNEGGLGYLQNLQGSFGNLPDYKWDIDTSDEAQKRAEEAAYNKAIGLNEETWANDRKAMETSLINRGIPVGSDAYNQQMNNFDNNVNTARTQAADNAVLTGQNVFNSNFQNQFNQAQLQNSIPGLTYGNYANLASSINSPSSYNLATDKAAIKQGNATLKQNNNNAMWGALSGLAGSGASLAGMALLSDRRAKEDVEKVGKTFKGLPIYTYKYKGDNTTHMGVMAQEAKKKFPKSVKQGGKYMMVDYSLIK